MYRISARKRKYSSTPIVRVVVDEQGQEREEILCICCNQTKKEDDALAERIVWLLNNAMILASSDELTDKL